MKLFSYLAIGTVAMLCAAGAAAENSACQDLPDATNPPACGPGAAIFNGGCANAGAIGFDLAGTSYDGTCATGPDASCSAIDVPSLRYWALDDWRNSNMGLQDQDNFGSPYLVGDFDAGGGCGTVDGVGSPCPGLWCLTQANWGNPDANGCGDNPTPRATVAEVSFSDAADGGRAKFAVCAAHKSIRIRSVHNIADRAA